jgi:uncharacterized membrane protein YbhN (UPF0104 family)
MRALLKLAIGAALVVWLLRRQDFDRAALARLAAHLLGEPLWLAATLAAVLACLLCGALRWRLALAGLGVPLSRGRAGAVFLAGHFFNGFLPGSTGGDVVRAVYAAGAVPARAPEAVMSIVIERLAGVAVLLLLSAAGLLLTPGRRHLPLALALFACGALPTLAALLALPEAGRVKRWPLVRHVAGVPRVAPLAHRLYAALRIGRSRPKLVLELAGWSVLQHAAAVASWLALAAGVGAAVQPLPFVLLVPAVLTAQMLPLTPGGLGVREGAAVALLPAAGLAAPHALAVALASYGASLAWSAAGGVVFVLLRERGRAPPAA